MLDFNDVAQGSFPCKCMAYYGTLTCQQHPNGCPDGALVRRFNQGGYGLVVYDNPSEECPNMITSFMITIWFCPWCGIKLEEPEGIK